MGAVDLPRVDLGGSARRDGGEGQRAEACQDGAQRVRVGRGGDPAVAERGRAQGARPIRAAAQAQGLHPGECHCIVGLVLNNCPINQF